MDDTINPAPDGVPPEIWATIVEVVAKELGCPESDIKPQSTFEELGADSLERIEVNITIEGEFLGEETIPYEDLEKVGNLGEYALLIVNIMSQLSKPDKDVQI